MYSSIPKPGAIWTNMTFQMFWPEKEVKHDTKSVKKSQKDGGLSKIQLGIGGIGPEECLGNI